MLRKNMSRDSTAVQVSLCIWVQFRSFSQINVYWRLSEVIPQVVVLKLFLIIMKLLVNSIQ